VAKNDVQLLIRARDEASKAVEGISGALRDLLGAQSNAGTSAQEFGSRLAELANVALTVDKAFAVIDGAATKATSAFARQSAALDESRASLAAVKAQAESAGRALEQLRTALVESALNGDATAANRLREQIKLVERAFEGLIGEQHRLTTSSAQQQAALDGQKSSLQQLGSFANAAEAAQAELQGELRKANIELARQQDILGEARVSEALASRADRVEASRVARAAVILAEARAHEENTAKLKAEQAATNALADAQARQKRETGFTERNLSGLSARDSASVFTQADTENATRYAEAVAHADAAEDQMTAGAAALRAQLDPVAAVHAKLNRELTEAQILFRAGKISALEYAAAQKLLGESAQRAAARIQGSSGLDSRGRPALFGLKPYELQNLGYQFNDLATQIASGTSVSQAFAQQIGQIFQILPKMGNALVAAFKSPPILLMVAAVVSFIAALVRAQSEAEKLRNFEGILRSTADGAAYSAKALLETAKALDVYGLSAAKAVDVVKILLRNGVNPDRIREFGEAAQDMADTLGIDVVEATEKLSKGFTGGYEAIAKFDAEFNKLSAAERTHIRELFESNRAMEARAEAFDLVRRKGKDASDDARGPWSEALRKLGEGWSNFLDILADSWIVKGLGLGLNALADGVTTVLDALNGTEDLNAVLDERIALAKEIETLEAALAKGDVDVLSWLQGDPAEKLKKMKDRLVELREESVKLVKELDRAGGDTRSAGSEAQKKADEDALRRMETQKAAAKELSNLARIELAYKTALLEEQNKGVSDAVAERIASEAASREALKVQKEITDEKEKQLSLSEQAVKSYVDKVVGVESGGDPNAKNPSSSATGLGQFIERTWLNLFRKHFPAEAANLGKDAILELRKDAETSKRMIEIYARENAEILKKAGLSVTEANLYLTHFLGPDGAVKVIKAAADTSLSAILGADQIAANAKMLQGKTAGDLRANIGRKFGEANSADSAITQRLLKMEQERAKVQAGFIEGIDQENQKRQQNIASLEAQSGLVREALLNEQKRQAVADAVLAKQQEIDSLNADLRAKGQQEIQFTEEQRAAIERLTAAEFELAHAKDFAAARRDTVQQPVDDLTAQRDQLLQQIEVFQEAGQIALADGLAPQLAAINGQLDQAIAKAVAFYESLANNQTMLAALGLTAEQLQLIIDKLNASGSSATNLGTNFIATGKQINQQFAQMATGAIDRFAQAVAEGKNVIQSLKEAFLQFAADFLRYIAQMILQQLIFNLISGGGGGSGGGEGGGGFGGLLSGLFGGEHHKGGIAGDPSAPTRLIDPRWIANARRYHGGGIAGLAPNEVPAILTRGEEILTKADPRHAANGGGGGQAPIVVKNVNLFDLAELASQLLGTAVGEQAVLNIIANNPDAIRAAQT